MYWYALKSFNTSPDEHPVQHIEKYFEKYHPVIQSIISATDIKKIHTATMSDLKPTNEWFADGLCLIGDAAHAMTPNMGQGACQSIEDAYVLSECLNNYELNEAFQNFHKLRSPKAHQIVKTSWTLGKVAHVANPMLIGLRNQMMKWTPNALSRLQSEKIFKNNKV